MIKLTFAIISATVYGLAMRLLFDIFGPQWVVMSMTFLFMVPFIIGFFTVFLLPESKVTSLTSAFFMPWLTTLIILVVTIAFNVEGAICWIMVYPLFATLTGFGGLMAYSYRNHKSKKADRNDTLNVSLLLLLPIFVGYLEKDHGNISRNCQIESAVIITAPANVVWQQLTHINTIASKQKHSLLTNVLGFPNHVKTEIDTLAIGGHRNAYYEKGLFFNETITGYIPQRLMVLAIKTDPSKIPANVMDEHIVIGGKHLDIQEDTYQLQNLPGGKCKLTLSSKFTICTPFNWYASIWSNYLISDILQGELDLIKQRSEAK